jgi:AcrR family transcriptional regulator
MLKDQTHITRGRKFDQVLTGARSVFLRDGFEGASVDDIAKEAAVSKATLYKYFPDKRLLFQEVVQVECRRQAETARAQVDMTGPLDAVLQSAAMQIVTTITSPFNQRFFRICVAESDRFPELGRAFYESGPMLLRADISAFLADANAGGVLRVTDIPLAADQFVELCKADIFPRMVFNIATTFSKEELRRIAKGAVETFLARYGV